MLTTTWYVLVGLLLVGVALARTKLANLPLSLSLIYLCVGVALGPLRLGLLDLDPVSPVPVSTLWFAPLLLLGIRPLAVLIGTVGTGLHGRQRALVAWFGIRGIGSIYYLMFAIEHGLEADVAEDLTAMTLALVAISVVVHGISVTPLMTRHAEAEAGARA